ncbi:MAG: ATP-dependent helicase [Candidatus Zixiibacteriota bacterium]
MADLRSAFERLDDKQKEAVVHDGNTVVLAGPGSGKTATLVLKVASLVTEVVPPPQGVACITFNNDAVGEFLMRLAEHGIYGSRRLFLGTVHSFCLNCVIRPYGALVRGGLDRSVLVASKQVADALLERIVLRHIPDEYGPSIPATSTRFRRARACKENISGFDDRLAPAIAEYEQALVKEKLVDFEAMVLHALEIIEEHPWIRELISSRFPWLVVDEYQDLGGPLHRIMTSLADQTETKIFAVGDPDQTVYDFTGADPKYLRELTGRDDVREIRLPFNYRSGGDLIAAGEAALSPEEPRGYRPTPGREDRGQIEFRKAGNSLMEHARVAVEAVKENLEAGVDAHEIAIFYRGKNALLPEIKAVLDEAGVDYIAERETTYPREPFCRWLQSAAGWATSERDERETSFSAVLGPYLTLMEAAGYLDASGSDLRFRTQLHEALLTVTAETGLGTWLRELDEALSVTSSLERAADRSLDDLMTWRALLENTESDGELCDGTVLDFADEGRVNGKVVVTTLHSSKGRQFDVVIIPGLVEGLTPYWTWNRRERRREEPTPKVLSETRRLFYVGFTRARHVVYLIYSDQYRNKGGYLDGRGPSRFVKEIEERLERGE